MYTGQPIVDFVLAIGGNILIIILVYNAIQFFAQKAWGAMLGLFAAAIIVGAFVWANSQTITFLKWLISQFFGG